MADTGIHKVSKLGGNVAHRSPVQMLRAYTNIKSMSYFTSKQEIRSIVVWNVYLPNAVAFHTRLSKYLTVIVMTLN